MPIDEKNESDETKTAIEVPTGDGKKSAKDEKKDKEEISEEDLALKEGLELAVLRLQESDVTLHAQALNHLASEIKSATSSMTSVPKPLKFLRPHYDSLKTVYDSWMESHDMKPLFADVLSVLAMTMAVPGSRECLRFKLLGTPTDPSQWGHEYVRCLAGEISEEYNVRLAAAEAIGADDEEEVEVSGAEELLTLVDDLLPFQLSHNAEAEAVDLLLELRLLPRLVTSAQVDDRNFERVCLYLLRAAPFLFDPDELGTLYRTAFAIYRKHGRFTDALRVALKMDDDTLAKSLFLPSSEGASIASSDADREATVIEKQQMALLLGRHRSHLSLEGQEPAILESLAANRGLSEQIQTAARAMDLSAARSVEEVTGGVAAARKAQAAGANGLSSLFGLNNSNAGAAGAAESARGNLASTFVNGFVHMAHGHDKLMDPAPSEAPTSSASANANSGSDARGEWLRRNRGPGLLCAAASQGLVRLWDVDEGINRLDPLLNHPDELVQAGAALGVGLVVSGVRDEADAALALLSDIIDTSPSGPKRQMAVLGLGVAYAGARRSEVTAILEPIAGSTAEPGIAVTEPFTEACLAALSMGLISCGSADDDIASTLLQRMMEATEEELDLPAARFLCLGLALLFLGKGEASEPIAEGLKTIEHRRGKLALVLLESCSFAASGNVLKVQEMLRLCAEHITDDKAAEHQAAAVLGVALIAMGEEVGAEMALRSFEHLLQYCEAPVRRAVPLALALLFLSHPDYAIVDQLSRLSHDQDAETAMGALLALGLVSAGSNNSRVATLLRQAADYHAKNADQLFLVRVAQGLNGLGKGLLGLSLFHSDRLLLQGPALGAVLTVLQAALDLKTTLLDRLPQLLFVLVAAANPRYLQTVEANEDGELKPVKVSVRVGLAVETVGQAGRPKTITGFQTHSTPVLLGFKDRAEIASREFKAATSVMEGLVIVEAVPVDENKA